jgi:hypothetical protein
MLDLGLGYKYAVANVIANSVVGITTQATIRPIYSPPGGHGHDAAAELGATRLGFSVKFSNSDIGLPLTNEYRTIGILKDPLFTDVTVNYTSGTGTFTGDERIFKIQGTRICDNASINTTSAVITANADFVNQLDVGEYIYFTQGTDYQLATVNSIVNSSYITISTNGYFETSSLSIYKTSIGSSVSNVDITTTALTGNLVTNATFSNVYGKGTNFSTDVKANTNLFIYANSSGSGEVKLVTKGLRYSGLFYIRERDLGVSKLI